MILSDHAKEEMLKDGISEDEVRQCLGHGDLKIKEYVDREMRYGRRLDMKSKSVVVIYTFRRNEPRIITAYTLRDKKWPR